MSKNKIFQRQQQHQQQQQNTVNYLLVVFTLRPKIIIVICQRTKYFQIQINISSKLSKPSSITIVMYQRIKYFQTKQTSHQNFLNPAK